MSLKPVYMLVLFLVLSGCSKKIDSDKPVDELYAQGEKTLEKGDDYSEAAKLFEEVERLYPYSALAPQAQIKAAYSYFKASRYDDALDVLAKFIQFNPSHAEIDYAYFLKALCYYEQITDAERDQELTMKALESLEDVIRRFPESKYAREARFKADLAKDRLAEKEMQIGRHYLHKKLYQAALNRFNTVIKTYQTTAHVPEALYRIIETSLALGLLEESVAAAAYLGHNFPGNKWYERGYKLVMDKKSRSAKTLG